MNTQYEAAWKLHELLTGAKVPYAVIGDLAGTRPHPYALDQEDAGGGRLTGLRGQNFDWYCGAAS